MKILIVDDEFTSRKILQGYCAPFGSCDVAVDGEEATFAFKEALESNEPYELLLLDIMMPKKNGMETLQDVRKIEEEKNIMLGDGVKIIMTTAVDESKKIMKSFREGCESYLIKPITKEKLLEEMKNLKLIS